MTYLIDINPHGNAACEQMKQTMLDLIKPEQRSPQIESLVLQIAVKGLHHFSEQFLQFCIRNYIDTVYAIKSGPNSLLLEQLYIDVCTLTDPNFPNMYVNINDKNIFFIHQRHFIMKMKKIYQIYCLHLLALFLTLKGVNLNTVDVLKTTPSYLLIRTL
jgi:hypothetical protein